MLSEIAIHDPATFDTLVTTARTHCSVQHHAKTAKAA
jgi:hypothetical protein